jgi:hypothetical protein
MNGNNKNLALIGLLVVIVGLGGIWTFIKYQSASSSPVADLGLVTYVNAQGQEWSIPEGEYEFKVSSEKKYPKFVTGFINPVDVKVGDTQKMLMVVDSDTPIKRVWAEVETDNTVRMVEMKVESSAPVSVEDYKNQPYLVDEDGVLVINSEENKETFAAKLTKIAEAADGVIQYRYEGEWIVEDTHTKTYHTRFVVEDEKGRLDSMTLAWSDPVCNFNSSGALTGDCTVSTGIEGFDGDSSLNGFTISFTGPATIVFTPGNKITIGTGKLGTPTNPVAGGAKISQVYPFFPDADGDLAAESVTISTSTSASVAGKVRLSLVRGQGSGTHYQIPTTPNLDCDSTNASVYPQQTGYFTTPITGGGPKNGTYDYNCDGQSASAVATQDYAYSNIYGFNSFSGDTSVMSACKWITVLDECVAQVADPSTGWIEYWPNRTTRPGCWISAGVPYNPTPTANYIDAVQCSDYAQQECNSVYVTRQQACR